MSKRTGQIIALIISVLGLAFLILSHYGAIRYTRLHLLPTESFLNGYLKSDKVDTDRVVIAFSATPGEMKRIKPFINSILDQTVRVDDIALTIPYIAIGSIPDSLKKVISVHGHIKDYDEASNLVCSVMREKEAKTKIIILEPNIVYGEDFIQEFVEASKKSPNAIIKSQNGILVKPEFFDEKLTQCEKAKLEPWLQSCSKVEKIEMKYDRNYKRW